MRKNTIFAFLLSAMVLVATNPVTGAVWPKNHGVYIAKSSASIPAFPKTLSDFRSMGKKDYWGEAFETSGSLRVFSGNTWETIFDGPTEFPHTMNHCSDGVFMVRWRAAYPTLVIKSAVGYLTDNVSHSAKSGSYGYMYATNCEMPLFALGKSTSSEGTLGDLYYEIKFWKAAP